MRFKEFNTKMSHSGIAYVLHRLNLSYTQSTYVLAKADKEKQEKLVYKRSSKKKHRHTVKMLVLNL